MRKLHTSIAIPVLVLGLSLPTLAQTQSDGTKSPTDPTVPAEKMPQDRAGEDIKQPDSSAGSSGDASSTKAKKKTPKVLPATKQMDKASSQEKTGVPDSGADPMTTPATGKAPKVLPATKQMDKASSPEKTGVPDK